MSLEQEYTDELIYLFDLVLLPSSSSYRTTGPGHSPGTNS
jgi:hypothetical protein